MATESKTVTALKKKENGKQVTVHPLHNSPHPSVKIGEVALLPLVRFFLKGGDGCT